MPTLHWLTRETDLKTAANTPCRLLVEEENYSYGDLDSSNLIVQGDNLEALKALLPFYAGQVNCIYIDPPYNTGSAFEHYDDNMEHTKWLSMIYPRLELLRNFLAEDGSIWISIDDDEGHYLKIICDEIFGRKNFICNIVWQKRYSRENREAIGDVHEYITVYTKNPNLFKQKRNLVQMNEEQTKVYKNPNNDPKGRWRAVPLTAQAGHATSEQFYKITAPGGKVFSPPAGRCWGISQQTYKKYLAEGRIYFGKDNNSQPNYIRYLSEVPGVAPWTWWPSNEVGHNDTSKKEILQLFGNDNIFDTPKPESLIQRILHIATNPGDFVLDSFLGSGTTAAVAHKMGRRYIGIEMGEHAKTHCAVRLKKVIDKEQGGISEAVGWKGGGGFRFLKLGEAIFDSEGRIKSDISFENLAAHIYFTETKTPMKKSKKKSAFLGIHNDTAYALLYNGILGDKSIGEGNVLTHITLNHIMNDIDAASKKKAGPLNYSKLVIYGEATRLTNVSLKSNNIIFKQTPYDIKVW
jgi:adenine-specific DNA-methyltransferase